MTADIKLALVKVGDWYTIERAEHDRLEWYAVGGNECVSLHRSCCISDADVEGDAYEMRAIADAIERGAIDGGASVEFKRCAVEIRGDVAEFWSPRNSRKPGLTSLACAMELAAQIRREIG